MEMVFLLRSELHVDGGVGDVVNVYDAIGALKLTMNMKSDKEVIDVSGLPKGIYVVVVGDGSGSAGLTRTVKKVVKE